MTICDFCNEIQNVMTSNLGIDVCLYISTVIYIYFNIISLLNKLFIDFNKLG